MGRKRVNEIKAGGKTTLYVPQDIDANVLKFFQDQKNLSKALLELAYMYVYKDLPRPLPSVGVRDFERPAQVKESKRAEAMKIILNTDKLG